MIYQITDVIPQQEGITEMATLKRILQYRLVSDSVTANLGQYVCFAAAPALFVMAIRGITRMATTQAEILIGVLASSAVALLLVIMGLLLPLAQQKAHSTTRNTVAESPDPDE